MRACKRTRCFHSDVRFCGNLGRSGAALDRSRRALVKAQLVAEIDELHCRLQQVITVGATADDVQAEIELRRRGPGELLRVHWPSRQLSTTMRTRAAPLLALIFTGTRAPGSVE